MKPSGILLTLSLLAPALLWGCSASSVDTKPATLGKPATLQDMQAVINDPGPIVFEKHLAANWVVPLSGLLNLDHPKAVAARIKDREEPIQIFVYSLQHPKYGTFLVDSGISEKFLDTKNNDDVSFVVRQAMNIPALDVELTTAALKERVSGVDGIFLTHIHMDHIMGIADLAPGTQVYIGPGDTSARAVMHLPTRGTTDRLLANTDALQEWQFDTNGIIDVFGDGSIWAIHTPGHTVGATAYLVRTTSGPQLLIGDATHTRWGWENGVEPGSYSQDMPLSVISLAMLKKLAQQYPQMAVHPGHQSLP